MGICLCCGRNLTTDRVCAGCNLRPDFCNCKTKKELDMKTYTVTENDLASANEQAIRADERAKVLAEVDGWLVDEEFSLTQPTYGRNQLRAKLRAKLAEMKGKTV